MSKPNSQYGSTRALDISRGGSAVTVQAPVQAEQGFGSAGADEGSSGISHQEVLRVLHRPQRLVLLVSGLVIVLASLRTAYERHVSPVYQGSFQLLISDPVSASVGGSGGGQDLSGTNLQQLALNRTSSDLPTLIEVLESPMLLDGLAGRYGTSAGALAGRITVETGGSKQRSADGVLRVNLTGRNPGQDRALLEDLAQTYLNDSQSQRQERLSEGLKFIERLAPTLESRLDALQSQLEAFRRTHNLLEPLAEGAALKGRLESTEQQVRDLQANRLRLVAARRNVQDGSLTARDFQEAIGSGQKGDTGLSLSGSAQGLLEQLWKLEAEIADGRSRYRGGSPMLNGLLARRQALMPLLQRSQLQTIDTALNVNASQLATTRLQQQVDRLFPRQPALIKQYAKTLAEMGQRVLIVDADLRKPQLHHRLGLNNLIGLSNLLAEDGLNWREVLQEVPGFEGWNLLSSGRVPPDPTRLLSSQRMRSLVQELADSGSFDMIIYDTPPVPGLADAALVAEHLDGLMLLVSLGRVDRGLPSEAIGRIRSSGAALLGIVTNAVLEEHSKRSGHGHGHGYGYGYGYGYGAYDPGKAYAYYKQDDDTESTNARLGPSSQPSHSGPLQRSQAAIRGMTRRFVSWIDG